MNAPVELPNMTQPERPPADALFERLEKESASFDLFQAMRRDGVSIIDVVKTSPFSRNS